MTAGKRTGDRPSFRRTSDHPANEALQRGLSTAASLVNAVPGAHALSGVSKSNRLIGFLIVNFVFMVIEFTYGYMNNSLGMLSDAAHMLLDNVAVAIGLAAEHYAMQCTSTGATGTSDPVRYTAMH